jgi:hypothetical protein
VTQARVGLAFWRTTDLPPFSSPNVVEKPPVMHANLVSRSAHVSPCSEFSRLHSLEKYQAPFRKKEQTGRNILVSEFHHHYRRKPLMPKNLALGRPELGIFRYTAFLSYSQAADGNLAPAVQALHGVARPWCNLRSIWIFRDKTGLSAPPSLWGAIETALAAADYCLLMIARSFENRTSTRIRWNRIMR